MKSLEHIIREIREGKCECEKKKDSLEHAIRKVGKKQKEYESSYAAKDSKPVEEAVGTLGTDKYQGNEFKSIRSATPHIKPPGPEHGHSQAPENASRQRLIAKEKAGINRVEEEQLDEFSTLPKGEIDPGIFMDPFAGKVIGGASPKAGKPARKVEPKPDNTPPTRVPRRDIPKPANEPGKETPVVPKPTTPDSTPPTKVPAREVPKPANVPEPAKPAPTKPAAPETPTPAPAPKELPKAVPGVVPGGLPLPVPFKQPEPEKAPKPEAKPEAKPAAQPKPQALPVIDVPAAKPEAAPKAEPKVAAVPAITPATQTATTPQPAAVAEPKTAAAEPEVRRALPGMGLKSAHDFGSDTLMRLFNPKKVHIAKKHRVHEDTKSRETIENMPRKGDRKSIEYVGRKDADSKTAKEKTSRLATIKNVIDEAKKEKEVAAKKQTSFEDGKTKVFDYGQDLLVISPDQRKVDLDVDNGEKVAKDYGK